MEVWESFLMTFSNYKLAEIFDSVHLPCYLLLFQTNLWNGSIFNQVLLHQVLRRDFFFLVSLNTSFMFHISTSMWVFVDGEPVYFENIWRYTEGVRLGQGAAGVGRLVAELPLRKWVTLCAFLPSFRCLYLEMQPWQSSLGWFPSFWWEMCKWDALGTGLPECARRIPTTGPASDNAPSAELSIPTGVSTRNLNNEEMLGGGEL